MGRVAIAIVLAAAVGCSSTSAGEGAADGAATTPDAQSDATLDGSGTACPPGGIGCTMIGGSCDCEPGVTCCYHEVCKPDAGPWLIQASRYNASCAVDSDCVPVGGFGDACLRCFGCPSAAINTASESQYYADVAKSPAANNACFCLQPPNGPCCLRGVCEMSNDLCPFSGMIIRPLGDAAADTGADAAIAVAGSGDAAADASAE